MFKTLATAVCLLATVFVSTPVQADWAQLTESRQHFFGDPSGLETQLKGNPQAQYLVGPLRLACLRKYNGNNDPINDKDPIGDCDIPEKATLFALYILATHHSESPWVQRHCVPRVPRGYRCDYREHWVIK